MATMTEYKCPCCGGAIEFDTHSQNMKCPYCDTEFDVETLKGYDEALKQDTEDNIDWQSQEDEWADNEMNVYVCESCGGEIIADENTAATSCPFCDNPVILNGRLSGTLKPDIVIPFKLDKKAAKEALKKHFEGKKLLPDIFKTDNKLDEIKGVYVPFWLFDCDADANVRYRMTKIRSWSDSKYHYTEKTFAMATRDGEIGFQKIPVDGSSKIADDMMESIEPFDNKQAVDFQTAYLAGYLADKYDVTSEQSIKRANQRVKKSVEEAFKATVIGYDTVTAESSNVSTKNGIVKYALYPVWLLNVKFNGEIYPFAMNGQTGKFVGNLPMDKGKFWKWFGGMFAVGAAAAFAIAMLLFS